MKLKNHLLSLNMTALLATICITAGLSLAFGYATLHAKSGPENENNYKMALLVGSDVIFSGPAFSAHQVQETLFSLSAGNETVSLSGLEFTITRQQYAGTDGTLYTHLALRPAFDVSGFYKQMIFFVLLVFVITFAIASLLIERRYERDMLRPLVQLKAAADRLAGGELDTPVIDCGRGEMQALCRALENLRLRLKESVLTSEKYDENRKFLLSSISHDLKTPVTAVRGYIDGVLDGIADTPEKQKMYLSKAAEKVLLIATMIDDLLLYSKLDVNQLPFSFSRVPIADYLHEVVREFQPEFAAEGRQLTLGSELQEAAVVRIDPERFRRVVQNILDNAKKHTGPESGAVTISLRETAASVIVDFHDNGPGISPEDLPHIFERFYRADAARRAGEGNGLGLAIAHQLVTGMDGRIWAVSKPGNGCSMIISLKKVKLMDEG